jgi:integrase
MAGKYAHGTIQQAKHVMHGMFDGAFENGLITSNPCKKSISADMGYPAKDREPLSDETLKKFLEEIKGNPYENQYRFVLQTGIRAGELVGLKWSDIDVKNECFQVQRTMCYISEEKGWRIGEPKSKAGKRTIPLTKEALAILKNQKEKMNNLKVIPLEWREYVFLNEKGELIHNNTYLASMLWICKKLRIPRFTMHILRHTFASRCISNGMSPKVLQTILGHAKFEMTMDYYVHSDEDEKRTQIEMVSQALKAI